jgi:ABC-type lipoprotein release transport system permease subunit
VITLVGLLGTIIGLIKGFTAVAQVNPAELEAANISFLNLVQRLRAESAAAQPAR